MVRIEAHLVLLTPFLVLVPSFQAAPTTWLGSPNNTTAMTLIV